MTLEVRPLGVACNIACHYCYQNPLRAAHNIAARYDLAAIKASLEAANEPFILFGGEPLLMPIDDLEELFALGYKKFQRNGIQTNGVLLTEAHVDLFQRYKVGVGISLDGPGDLNDLRWAGTLERTRQSTEQSIQAIKLLVKNKISLSLIVTLHRGNASPEKLSILKDWFIELDSLGVRAARIHLLEVESREVRDRYALTTAENVNALQDLAKLQSGLKRLRFDVVDELKSLLAGNDREASCVWRGCDPLTTLAARGIEGNGQLSNCSRTNKLGVDFVRADLPSYERYIALYHTPFADGGCQGCRFFLQCKGQCPGTAIDGDWRNRTEYCNVWMELFELTESKLLADGKTPLSVNPQRRKIEHQMLAAWAAGQNPTVESLISQEVIQEDCHES